MNTEKHEVAAADSATYRGVTEQKNFPQNTSAAQTMEECQGAVTGVTPLSALEPLIQKRPFSPHS